MSGEIPEAHKQELEMNRDLVRQKSREVVDLQQQLAKLSTIVDKKTAAMSDSSSDIRWALALEQSEPYTFSY